jgi:hypothetical protein
MVRKDLLRAVASIDWAVSNLPSFETKIDDWLRDNVYADVIDIQGSTADQLVVAVEKELLPLSFVVEAGTYINANLERHGSHSLKAAICPDPFPEHNPSTATRQRPQSYYVGDIAAPLPSTLRRPLVSPGFAGCRWAALACSNWRR